MSNIFFFFIYSCDAVDLGLCVGDLRPSQPKEVMLSKVNLPYYTFTG